MTINVFKPKYRTNEVLEEIKECLEIGWTGLGFKTEKFEQAWNEYSGFENSHLVSSNTIGLQISIKILKDVNKWKDGDEIITTPLTFVSSNHSILYNNLKPVFADVDDQLCLDPRSVESLIGRKTRAVMFVGIGGNIGRYNEIKDLCEKHNLKLILDAAHMAGTKVERSQFGSVSTNSQIGWDADVAVFSFQSVKNLPTADSGMICFKNKDYDILARKLSWLGIDKDTFNRTNSRGSYKWDYDVIDLGFKAHGNSVIASMGLVGLKYLDEDNLRRREICELYDLYFVKETMISPILHSSDCESSRHLYQIRVSNRNRIMEYLNSNDIYPGVHYKDNTQYEMYAYARGSCPNSHVISEEVISLPLHMFLTNQEVEYIAEKVKEAVKK